ncbi:putative bifunctional diguanylate cyclase/phosphodiesterase [Streptomyces eurocidicus]|uniref:Diguanylate cyclase (GGDEF)-like protein/PAS domain S-box-containing protein n=2 Tax=Streptomyces eurocidicus TaxID=66423 RepID=A0A7W8F180_STREU|nr:EAL domain-containing protein [Streptomyces eurocidicus]MBB5118217.1 diguanylate cyclase (GGDEF)-like protein/PAS domain S-box-containing protein [Streptomyces eurocidicus]
MGAAVGRIAGFCVRDGQTHARARETAGGDGGDGADEAETKGPEPGGSDACGLQPCELRPRGLQRCELRPCEGERDGEERGRAAGRDPGPDVPGTASGDGPRRFAAVWNRVIHPATATPMTRDEFESHLVPLVERLAAALRAPEFDPAPAAEVGAALVKAHCTDPETLPLILGAVDAHLLAYCPPGDGVRTPEEARARCAGLQHAVAAGFAGALRERTLAEQEALSRAALAAQAETERALHTSEARFRAVFEGAAIGVGIADVEGRIMDVNDALTQMFGSLAHEVTGRNVGEMVHPDDAPGIWGLYRELVRGDRDFYRIEKPYYRSDGSVLWTDLTVSLLRDAHGRPQYQLALMEDITERRLLHERLRYEATHDALTGLPNRTLFFEALDRALDTAGGGPARFGLCYLDLDGFKAVNDSLGHAVGDRLLVAVADRLRSCVTAPEQLVARLGGDEFVALLTGPSAPSDATALARRMLAALAEPVRLEGRDLSVRASIGIVDGAAGGRDAAEVLRSADITMYRAKAAGGNRYELADADCDARAIARHSLTNGLPAALENGEFFIEYQPLVRLTDGSVRGAEALVRWLHPVHGVLGPDQFIPLAESTGLIVPLGRWVLEEAARQARAWRSEGKCRAPMRVNVNLSPSQLRYPSLVAETVAVLENAGLPPSALCLEVTENALIGADEEELRPLRQLADMGVDIALDDFGTGYSNLSYLRRLPVSTLKLDRSFTRGMQCSPADPVDVKIVEGIVSLAHTLDLSVTVEGVETGTQAEHLRGLGCDTAQGWYYARPGPPERLCASASADASP